MFLSIRSDDGALGAAAGGRESGQGFFGRLFPELRPLRASESQLRALGERMSEPTAPGCSLENPTIPSGYTYLAQLIDHDITFDATPLSGRTEDPWATRNFRSPGLDLDSLYGSGPVVTPFLYRRVARGPGLIGLVPRFALGAVRRTGHSGLAGRPWLEDLTGEDAAFDLPRRGDGLALLLDPRNDENLLVAQLHVVLARFHNHVARGVEEGRIPLDPGLARAANLPDASPDGEIPPAGSAEAAALFEGVRQIVVWHYQWIVLHDVLPQIVDRDVLREVLERGPLRYRPEGAPYLPVELTAAAYRLGHSMVRETYDLNRIHSSDGFDRRPVPLTRLFEFTGAVPSNTPVPEDWVIDWRRFFVLEGAWGTSPPVNQSRRIDPLLAPGLASLPIPGIRALAQRNLLRGLQLGLPSGQDAARALGIAPLSPQQVQQGPDGDLVKKLGLHVASPLWYYILKEAQVLRGGQWLGPLGSRIVAEVFVGLLRSDPHSFLRLDPAWRPGPPIARAWGRFQMADLIQLTEWYERIA